MNFLIQISQITLNGAEVNSVNLRELHTHLKSKRQFADYAKGRLGRFVVNEDYVCISQKSEIGNKPLIEYYVTFETAKMIAMMENNETGDEVRRYFVNIEKQYLQNRPKTELDLIIQSAQEMQKIKEVQSFQENRIFTLEQTRRLENWQEKQLQDSKNFKVYEILKSHNFGNDKEMERKLHSRVWKAVKKKFNVPRYNEVPSLKFNEANDYIRRLTFGELV